MAHAAGANGKPARRIRLSEQFQLVRISEHEYKLVSLFDQLSVTVNPGLDGMLDRVLPALGRGTGLKPLVTGVSKRESAAIRAMIRDFAGRGVVAREPAAEVRASGNGERYANQRRFFSNFQAIEDMTLGANANEDGAEVLQRRLEESAVMLVGLGRVGSRVAQALASSGVGTIVGADPRAVAERDLADSAFVTRDAGTLREHVLADHLAAVNPLVEFTAFDRPVFAAGGAQLPDGIGIVALCEDVFDPAHHAAINRACIQKNVPWIGYRAYRTRVEIGPTVIPRETACYHCYELRRASNSAGFVEELELQTRLAAGELELGGLNVTLGADLLALEIVKSITHFTGAVTYGNVFTMDVVTLETRTRPLLKIPRCPECGTSASRPVTNIWRYDADGRR